MLFQEVIGQEELKRHLIDEVNGGKISHAQLFLGKPGFGGLALALAFTQYLFCENRTAKDSCGTCPSCSKIMKLQHPDLHFSFPTVQSVAKISNENIAEWREQVLETPYFDLNKWIDKIDPKGRKPIIGTAESAEIVKKLSLRSFEGGYKVMIIWMAEEMNQVCANKLLKIIEEPPQKTLFLLVTESQDKMLQTILSRTQVLKIPRVQLDELINYLSRGKGLNASGAESIAGRSDGDVIEADELSGSHEDQENNREHFIQLMRVCYKKSVLEMMEWADVMAKETRMHQKDFLAYALHMFRQSMLRNYTEDHLTRVSVKEDEFLEKFARFITGNNINDFMKTFNDAHYHIERNANARLLFTNLCFEVMRYIHKA
jgi:DNA polymerase-3 subunit delta'